MKNNSIYVITLADEWDPDYIEAFTSINSLAQGLSERLQEEDIFIETKMLAKHIKEREKSNCVFLLVLNEIDETISSEIAEKWIVRKTFLR